MQIVHNRTGRPVWGPECDGTAGYEKYSFLVRLTPYLDQPALFASVNFSREFCPERDYQPVQANSTALNVRLAFLICPTDGGTPEREYVTSYRGNVGVGPHWDRSANCPDSGNGFFPWEVVGRASFFPDGLSHTVALSERLLGTGNRAQRNPERDFGDPLLGSWTHKPADFALKACRYAATRPEFPAFVRGGFQWYYVGLGNSHYTHAQEPNGSIPDALARADPPQGVATARSHHPGGVNVLMGDGSNRFVAEDIDRSIWRAIGTRNGGEVVE
jgi:prepilin-type processing-associated H-X9-DG protein